MAASLLLLPTHFARFPASFSLPAQPHLASFRLPINSSYSNFSSTLRRFLLPRRFRHGGGPIPASAPDGDGDFQSWRHTHEGGSAASATLGNGEGFQHWDDLTAKFSAAANVPFLLLQLPQIILNARNLMAHNTAALSALPWLGMLTGLLGNLSLLSYFARKRETGVMLVQALGVISSYVVISQLAMAGTMPLPHFTATSTVVASGLVLNLMNYFSLVKSGIWQFWEDFITIAGLSVLPQIMWSTFVPYIPPSILPGTIAFVTATVSVVMARRGKLPEKGVKVVGALSGWTATLLFMWMPVAQMWTNFLNHENLKGLSAFSMLLAMIGNGLMIPRALFIRDFMWFTGSFWASIFYGWGNLICLFLFKCIGMEFFWAATAGLYLWIGMAFWKDAQVRGHKSALACLRELVLGA